MTLYLYQANDDSASAATLVLHYGEIVDGLVQSIQALGGKVHALVATAGKDNLVGLIDLPDAETSAAFGLLERSRGRKVQLTEAVAVGDFADMVGRLKPLLTTSSGDEPVQGEEQP